MSTLQATPAALPPGSTIGIVGGGQLGRMSALAAARLGYLTHVLTDDATGPAAQVASSFTLGTYDDPDALRAFAAAVDVVTFEFENISAEGLDLLNDLRPVRPSGTVLRLSQDRLAEKSALTNAGIQVASYRMVTTDAEAVAAVAELGGVAILKTTRLGYDGRGQRRVDSEAAARVAFTELAPLPLVAEAVVDFACEISVMVARGVDGAIACFDVVQNIHTNHILDLTLAPAPIDPAIASAAQVLARRIAEAIDLVGLMGVEMFVDANGKLLVNEIAPRPHNSGHWTIDACPVSQFEMHIRAVAGLPLPPARRHSDAAMKNLVGAEAIALWPEIVATDGLLAHHYGKAEARTGRKLGHVNVLFPRGALPGPAGIASALGPLGGDPSRLMDK